MKKKMNFLLKILCFLIIFPGFFAIKINEVNADVLPTNFSSIAITTGLSGVTSFDFAPDGRIFVAEQTGGVRVIKNSTLLSTPAITLQVDSNGERGLIGIAVDPNFATNKYIYLHHTVPASTERPKSFNRIARFTFNGDVIDSASQLNILDMYDLGSAYYHNGGAMAFGADGKLFIATGDNTTPANSQNLDSYLGKILRINSDGTIPAGNPFTGNEAKSRIWSYGLRNPYNLSFDSVTNKIYVNDVGENAWEEINDITSVGKNYGWPNAEGNCTSNCSAYTNPIHSYPHGTGDGKGCAITGGTVLPSASNYPTQYKGKYFFLDYCNNWINYIDLNNPSVRNSFGTGISSYSIYLKADKNGILHYISRANSTLYKIVYTSSSTAPFITTQPSDSNASEGQSVTFTVAAGGTAPLAYQWRKNGTNISGATSASYNISSVSSSHAGQYSVVVSNSEGNVTSRNAVLTVSNNNNPIATINTPAAGSKYRFGDTINYSGSATDSEDGSLPSSAFEWTVDFNHDSHSHPGPNAADGVKTGSFSTSGIIESDPDVFYRLTLTVTDSGGFKDTTFVDIQPVKSTLQLQTEPTGLQLKLDQTTVTTPFTSDAVSGMARTLEAPSTQTLNNTNYIFDRWENNGSRVQTINITDTNAIYKAYYKVSTSASITLSAIHDAYVRAGSSYSSTTFGTTDPNSLNTRLGNDSARRDSYLTFDISSVGTNITNVKLRVYGKIENTSAVNIPVGIYSVSSTSWSESSVNWNNRPVMSSTAIANSTVTDNIGRYYEWDITNYVKAQKTAGASKVSLGIKNKTFTTPRILWNSSEAGGNTPQLVVTY